jgi:hypothetical protein
LEGAVFPEPHPDLSAQRVFPAFITDFRIANQIKIRHPVAAIASQIAGFRCHIIQTNPQQASSSLQFFHFRLSTLN